MAGYRIAEREQAVDFMEAYPGFGEMRGYTDAVGAEQIAFSWRSMPPGTGGRGSYGHRHPGREELFFVISGRPTFKVGDDVFEAAPKSSVLMDGSASYSVHNDTDAEVELFIVSLRDEDNPTEREDGFWPE